MAPVAPVSANVDPTSIELEFFCNRKRSIPAETEAEAEAESDAESGRLMKLDHPIVQQKLLEDLAIPNSSDD